VLISASDGRFPRAAGEPVVSLGTLFPLESVLAVGQQDVGHAINAAGRGVFDCLPLQSTIPFKS